MLTTPGTTCFSTGARVGRPRSSVDDDEGGCASAGSPAARKETMTEKTTSQRLMNLMTRDLLSNCIAQGAAPVGDEWGHLPDIPDVGFAELGDGVALFQAGQPHIHPDQNREHGE